MLRKLARLVLLLLRGQVWWTTLASWSHLRSSGVRTQLLRWRAFKRALLLVPHLSQLPLRLLEKMAAHQASAVVMRLCAWRSERLTGNTFR